MKTANLKCIAIKIFLINVQNNQLRVDEYDWMLPCNAISLIYIVSWLLATIEANDADPLQIWAGTLSCDIDG